MASGLERSVPELFDEMIGGLDLSDLARLLVCSKSLQRRIEPMLYGSKDAYTTAVRWACLNGNLSIIRRAIAYGPSLTAIETPHVLAGNPAPAKVLTLYLAAKQSRAHAFRLLLELGAQVSGPDADVDANQVKKLMRRLCTPRNLPLLQAFVEAGLDAQVRARHCQEVAWPLVDAIRSGASPRLVEILLERGANPSHVRQFQGLVYASPLSAAIAANSAPLVNLLLAHGADIDGTDLATQSRDVLHIPVFAAAHAMARHPHDRAMMQLCLDAGADINRATCSTFQNAHFYTTPLHAYLDAIETWEADADTGCGPAAGLKYLLDRGAVVDSTLRPPASQTARPPYYSTCSAPTSVELLLDKWWVPQLTEPEFVATLEILIRRQPDAGNTSTLLTKYDYRAESEPVVAGWHTLLTALLAGQHDANATALLQALFLARRTTSHSTAVWSFGTVAVATIDRLLAAGADINAPLPGHPGTYTLLHALCADNRRVAEAGAFMFWPDDRCKVVSLLVSKGADPTIPCEGETPIDMLTAVVEFPADRCRGFITNLISILRGEEPREKMSWW